MVRSLLSLSKAAVAYALAVFAIGFVLGTIRLLLLVPRLGATIAVSVEMPLILALSWYVCGAWMRFFVVGAEIRARARYNRPDGSGLLCDLSAPPYARPSASPESTAKRGFQAVTPPPRKRGLYVSMFSNRKGSMPIMGEKQSAFLWYLLAGLLVLAFFELFVPQQQTPMVPYSDFKTLLANGKVTEATIGPDHRLCHGSHDTSPIAGCGSGSRREAHCLVPSRTLSFT